MGHQMCLWNGFIAAAPGHPFLAMVIENVVNNVRNRFTLVDVDNLFCPNPELSVVHTHRNLIVSGPCILGASVNAVLGRHGQRQFRPGGFHDDLSEQHIPGRTVLLKQNKDDVSASNRHCRYCFVVIETHRYHGRATCRLPIKDGRAPFHNVGKELVGGRNRHA